MGYTTTFEGHFDLTPTADAETLALVNGLNDTGGVMDGNTPPTTQPGLNMGWRLSEDGKRLEWDLGEKFYDYVDWLRYLIDRIFEPRGIRIEGRVAWNGEELHDIGLIEAHGNSLRVTAGTLVAKVTVVDVYPRKEASGDEAQMVDGNH